MYMQSDIHCQFGLRKFGGRISNLKLVLVLFLSMAQNDVYQLHIFLKLLDHYWIFAVFYFKIRLSFEVIFPSTECSSERESQQSNRKEEKAAREEKLRTRYMHQINSYI